MCNLDCPWCQNWHISKVEPPKVYDFISPERIVELAIKYGDIGLCASFNEPTLLFEYLLDSFKLAKSKGLVNTMVSNGFMTIKALRMLIDAGIKTLLSAPNIALAMCGMISPIKATIPLTQVTEATAPADKANTISLSLPTFTPKLLASYSLSDNMFSLHLIAVRSTRPSIAPGKAIGYELHETLYSPPMSQNMSP
ncbi:MAG TPA: radical SAM protein [Aquificaceae bacterium]|nr:radical SAM protein [Aquificaceae bacterium]